MIFPIKSRTYVDRKKFQLNFKIWDYDVLSKNDYLASATYDIWPVVDECILSGVKSKSHDKITIEANTRKELNDNKKPKIIFSVECLTSQE